MSNIKISQLDPFPSQIVSEDFIPVVDSSSMTTYRTAIKGFASLMSHSLNADTASYAFVSSTASIATTASNAITASYAKTASVALNIPSIASSSFASHSFTAQYSLSSSYSSHSHDAGYATRSVDVDITGTNLVFPFWNNSGTNGSLNASSPLTICPNNVIDSRYDRNNTVQGPVFVDTSSIRPESNSYPWISNYSQTAWTPNTNMILSNVGPGGVHSYWPITSNTFNGVDQRYYAFWTGSGTNTINYTNSYFSGSSGDATSGSWRTIPIGPGAISSSFNKKWMRIISYGGNPSTNAQPIGLANHASTGEVDWGYYQDVGGLIRIQISTLPGSVPGVGDKTNTNQIIWLFINAGAWTINPSAHIMTVNVNGPQLVSMGRLSYSSGGDDPWFCFDLMMDNFSNADDAFIMSLQSWGNCHFLRWPNVGPWPLSSTGSNDPHQANYLIFPVAPGHYTNANKSAGTYGYALNYHIQGTPLVINPTYNEITTSAVNNAVAALSLSLHVSGGINSSDAFYCANNKGLTARVLVGTTNLYFSGGILIGKVP